MSESLSRFLVDLLWGIVMFLIAKVIIAGSKAVWRKFRTPKDPVVA